MTGAVLEHSRMRTESSQRFYRPELDVLRFFAFLLVFMYHAISPTAHLPFLLGLLKDAGSFGVPIFFLLSAYLITELLLREKAKSGTISLRRFYVRRILRIWPLYFGFLFSAFALGQLIHRPELHFAPITLLGAILMAGNFMQAAGYNMGLASMLWSISVEEQFYLLWPFLARILTRERVVLAGATIWVISQIITAAMIHHHVPYYNAQWYSSFPHFQYFGLGIMMSAYRPRALPIVARILMGIAGFFVLVAAGSIAGPYFVFPTAGIGALLIFLAFLGFPMAAEGPLQSLGKISYGLYVFHGSALLITHVLSHRLPYFREHPAWLVYTLSLPLTILFASLSYRYWELPFLRLKERFEVVKSRPA